MRSPGKTPRKKYKEPTNFNSMSPADKLTGITLTLMAAIIPLIVKYAEVPVGTDENLYITETGMIVDMFSYYKSIFIILGSCILLSCLCEYAFSKRLRSIYNWKKLLTSPLCIGVFVFLLTIIASCLFTKYWYTAIHGISERYESVFILLSYLVIFASAFLFTRSEFQCRLLIYGLMFSCLIIGLIGSFQFFGMDFFMTETANKLVIGFNSTMRLVSPFTRRGQTYSTLYNPNSVGVYAALMLPLTVMGAICYTRGIIMRVWFMACGIVTLISAIGTNSAGGFAGIAVSAVVLLIVFICLTYKNNKRAGKKMLIRLMAGFAGITVIIFLIGPIRTRLYSVSQKLLNWEQTDSPNLFWDLKITGGTVEVVTKNGSIFLSRPLPESDIIEASITGGSVLTPDSTEEDAENNYILNSYKVPGFKEFIVEEAEGVFAFEMNNISFVFAYDADNKIMPLSHLMEPIDLSKPVNAFGFEGMELWGTGRGYIWSRTLPLLKQRWLAGSGPDSYILEFPQDDIIGKVRYLGDPYMIVDKAHNLFLQTGVNTGVISMLALLFIFAWYIIANFSSVLKGSADNEEKWMFGMRIAILAGVCGYAAASMATDSTVSVSPIFWMVLGIGAALSQGGVFIGYK